MGITTGPITRGEVKNALKTSKKGKADGLNSNSTIIPSVVPPSAEPWPACSSQSFSSMGSCILIRIILLYESEE